MIAGMDALAETELVEAIAGLGNWHQIPGADDKKMQYLVNKDECKTCLKDILIALRQDSREQGYLAHLKLGEWKVLPEHLVPLFAAYREDKEMANTVLKVLMQLTTHVDVNPAEKLRLLKYLQDYKEAFVKKDVFIILMGMLVESMEDEEETQQRGDGERNDVFEEVLTLMCNLMSTPDPRPGDAGYTPMRKSLQLSYIKHFHDEGVLDFFLLFAEQLESERNAEQVWSLLSILYHIVTQVDPEGIMMNRKDKDRRVLAELLERDQAHARINRTQSTRHSRFGFTIQTRDAVGGVSNSASIHQSGVVSKGSRMWGRDFRNSLGGGSKENMFHDPFFADLEEGSVRDHNQINPHVKLALETSNDLSEGVLSGLRKFFEEFVQTSFTQLVSFARGTVLQVKPGDATGNRQYGRQILLNFMSWILEFHRHHYIGEVAKAKQSKTTVPTMDIASVQGGIDLDMIQFVTARLREYGKEAHIHSSFLVIVLRALCQQVKTIAVVMDSQDAETRDCGEILTQNMVKEDVMAQLCWIMKNFKSSTHDPRVLTYTVEVFHLMTRLMQKITDRHPATKVEFFVERARGAQLNRVVTSVSGEIETLADANVVENLFHLLEKYKRHSEQLNSMLVKLIYTIIRAEPANIVVFFELSYFVRIHRMWSDPLIRDRKQGKKYQQMIDLLRFILRQFFKCAERNRCVFVELLFRKTFEKRKDSIMESHQSEFQAILDNYEDEGYAQFLEKMRHGESFDAIRKKQRDLQDGNLPWSEEEDAVLRDRYTVFMDHPLCLELLAAELPEDSRRTVKGVKKRLLELGMLQTRGSKNAPPGDDDAGAVEGSPAKRARLEEEAKAEAKAMDEFNMEMPMFQDGEDIDSLEMDLEKLLDAEESRRAYEPPPNGGSSGSSGPPPADAVDPDADTQPGLGMDLELELEAMIDESGSLPQEPSQAAEPVRMEADSLEAELEALIGSESQAQVSQTQSSQPQPPASAPATNLEDELATLLEESGIGTQPGPAPTVGATEPDGESGDEAQFWEDAVLAGSPNKPAAVDDAGPRQPGSAPAPPSPDVLEVEAAPQEDYESWDIEKLQECLDNLGEDSDGDRATLIERLSSLQGTMLTQSASDAGATSQRSQFAGSQESTLETTLERMIDESLA